MLKILKKENMGTSNLGWLESRFHFSFAEYRNPDNINFGVLRVLNDDIVHPNSGFDTHPHSNMEIISYVVKGEITHKDSMGNSETLKKGEVQYLSAGDGISHSEHNIHNSQDLRLLQIWIVPPFTSLPKLYGSNKFKEEERRDKLLHIISSEEGKAVIRIHQDVNIYVSQMSNEKEIEYKIAKNRQVYFVQIEGTSTINNIKLNEGDALEITKENNLDIKAIKNSHFLFIEMKED
jgi:redox-sensitive bicupin YhaK (pirin superfamily)